MFLKFGLKILGETEGGDDQAFASGAKEARAAAVSKIEYHR